MSAEPLRLHPDRFFSPDPAVRRVARELYETVADLPLVCPHGHVPPALLAEDAPFPEPTALLLTPDHYIFRMLYSQGVSMEALGIPTRDGTTVEADPRAVWQRFADHYHLFLGTPTRAWLDHTFAQVFGIDVKLSGETAMDVYDAIDAKLGEPDFRPRALFDRFNIDVLTTTDGAADTLEHHRAIRESEWDGRVLPCFRPDAVFRIAAPEWAAEMVRLGDAAGVEVTDYAGFIRVLEERRAFFKSMGATSTDHAVVDPLTHRLDDAEADRLLQRALRGEATAADQAAFEAHMLMEMARMSVEDGLVMQLHPGSFRDHNPAVFRRFGRDMGADIPLATEYTRNLRALLNVYGTEPGFTLVVFTLDESTYSRELAPLAGHYPAMRLGPAWWFFDSIEGMRRYRQRTTETAGFYNTAGFNDDTRAFLSIPARHDLSRRVDADYLAGLVAEHRLDESDAHGLIQALAVGLARDTYNLGEGTPESLLELSSDGEAR
ncbi:glucuronate isomerase [Rubrivirga marina]|uniref:Uronate isomerase n=1 Tax=Rubrivirga marina TaxID=1196024 RepID=A0A271IWA0_9BACT|nr:glucuronate isomerase [Rubrivirga marina]PAP75400.1 glucuronate isomerase [Rubrivirga marina]